MKFWKLLFWLKKTFFRSIFTPKIVFVELDPDQILQTFFALMMEMLV